MILASTTKTVNTKILASQPMLLHFGLVNKLQATNTMDKPKRIKATKINTASSGKDQVNFLE